MAYFLPLQSADYLCSWNYPDQLKLADSGLSASLKQRGTEAMFYNIQQAPAPLKQQTV